MDDIEVILTSITSKVSLSKLSEVEKAEVLSQLTVGMHRLVWPILLSHVPEYVLKEVTDKKSLTMDEYVELIESALKNPATAREIHDEFKAALLEVQALVGV